MIKIKMLIFFIYFQSVAAFLDLHPQHVPFILRHYPNLGEKKEKINEQV